MHACLLKRLSVVQEHLSPFVMPLLHTACFAFSATLHPAGSIFPGLCLIGAKKPGVQALLFLY